MIHAGNFIILCHPFYRQTFARIALNGLKWIITVLGDSGPDALEKQVIYQAVSFNNKLVLHLLTNDIYFRWMPWRSAFALFKRVIRRRLEKVLSGK